MTKHSWFGMLLVGAVLVATTLASACAKKDEASRPAGVPAMGPGASAPPVAPIAPAAAPPPAKEVDPSKTITGRIVLDPGIAKVKPKGILYLVARRLSDNPSARGTLVAVKKFDAATFPVSFSMSAADMPFQNGAFDGELTLSARIDQDGDPITRQKGDVFGALPKVQVGSRDVQLPIDQVQKESESLGQPGAMGGQLPAGHP